MILYYAIGGGLGHLTRARAVVHTLGLDGPVTVVCSPLRSSPSDSRVLRDLLGSFQPVELPAEAATRPDLIRQYLVDTLERTSPELVLVDAFPGGILGELCDVPWPSGLELRHVARLLQWRRYHRRLRGHLPAFERTFMVEPLTAAHRSGLEIRSQSLEPLRLEDPPAARSEPLDDETLHLANSWIVVHSEPDNEILELVAYADELRRRRDPDAELLVVSPERPQGLDSAVRHVAHYPAQDLFPMAKHIVSACGFNTMRQTEPFRHKHSFLPFERSLDDPFERARRARQVMEPRPQAPTKDKKDR